MTPDRDSTFVLCSCCSSLGVRYDFIVLHAERDDDELDAFVRRLSIQDQAATLAKLRHIHR